jgi:zinc transporter ZupT
MIVAVLVLFFTTMAGGLMVYFVPGLNGKALKLPLVFAGAYLFSITIIHIMPELYEAGMPIRTIGIFVLLGFFGQFLLEYLTAGVEHGHMHIHEPNHSHGQASIYMLMFGLSIHSLLEGTLVAHPHSSPTDHNNNALLLGIILHKVPAAFALMSVFTCQFKTRKPAIFLLFLFSIMSPLGILLGDFIHGMSTETITLLFAFVSGNFLHISTTIFFESSPEHRWSFPKLLVIVLGIMLAVLTDIGMS